MPEKLKIKMSKCNSLTQGKHIEICIIKKQKDKEIFREAEKKTKEFRVMRVLVIVV